MTLSEMLQSVPELSEKDAEVLLRAGSQMQYMADLSNTDIFLDCPIGDGKALVVAHAKPVSGTTAYERDVTGEIATAEKEPAVFNAIAEGVPICDIKAETQEGRPVRQNVCPVLSEDGRVIGVLQLINSMDESGKTIPFDPEYEEIISAMASLAAVSLNNSRLARAVLDILHSFVTVMVDAIDARSSYNANHTKSMVKYAAAFLDWMNQKAAGDVTGDAAAAPGPADGQAEGDDGFRSFISEEQRDPFLMSVWLHDIGKLVIPLEIMDKATRLGPARERILHRIETALLLEEIRGLKHPSEAADAENQRALYRHAADVVRQADTVGFLNDGLLAELEQLKDLTLPAAEEASGAGGRVPLFTPEEWKAVTVRRGTLTAEERREIERHVEYTGSLLSKMVFEGDYEPVPRWASMHHELLDGSGYPDHVSGDQIPPEVRLLTILDVYDALTAEDRPYKPPMPAEKAFAILQDMADHGKLDGALLAEFRESGAWKKQE